VASVLADSLGADEEAITPVARLHGDLGADSIDLLDIVFRLEREFGIEFERDELFPASIFQRDTWFTQDGKLTDSGLVRLRSQLPYADLNSFAADRRVSAIPDLFTVGLVTQFIAWKLGQGAKMDAADDGSRSGHSESDSAVRGTKVPESVRVDQAEVSEPRSGCSACVSRTWQ
jgi:acyl carrier protein